jgi:hypothetical protein
LQFWRLYEASEVLPFFAQANEKLRSIVERPDVKNEIDESGAVERKIFLILQILPMLSKIQSNRCGGN